ncbi:MAG: hypothetical protein Sv326_0618 [Candidatus Fermentimicrarchaeum limneticum]|uniref:Uncharacterized protein n=1 Tax=Fermentimicrarchaeum limneticum TaxID=2795018 RepID=A0A7D5XEU9_FERL1|nr:MAG: hypothetical protein Sv326_0618 [Candidatus Fermentimicrarchaeum limneticum]
MKEYIPGVSLKEYTAVLGSVLLAILLLGGKYNLKELVLILVLAVFGGLLIGVIFGPIGAFLGFWSVIYAFYRKEKQFKGKNEPKQV